MKRLVALALSLSLAGCGGGSGIGPDEIKNQEKRLRDRLPIDWSTYNTGSYEEAIEFFSKTMEQADTFEGLDEVRNEVKSEAHNGIAWSYFRLQDLESAWNSFQQATRLDRRNTDAWAGWAGVALASQNYNDAAQFAIQALESDAEYKSALRIDDGARALGHDRVDKRHIRLMLAESYFQLGSYSATERSDPNNAAAQVRLIRRSFDFIDPGQLLAEMSAISTELQLEASGGF